MCQCPGRDVDSVATHVFNLLSSHVQSTQTVNNQPASSASQPSSNRKPQEPQQQSKWRTLLPKPATEHETTYQSPYSPLFSPTPAMSSRLRASVTSSDRASQYQLPTPAFSSWLRASASSSNQASQSQPQTPVRTIQPSTIQTSASTIFTSTPTPIEPTNLSTAPGFRTQQLVPRRYVFTLNFPPSHYNTDSHSQKRYRPYIRNAEKKGVYIIVEDVASAEAYFESTCEEYSSNPPSQGRRVASISPTA